MERIPVIHIEIEGIREKIQYAFMQRSSDFNEMIAKALDACLKPEIIEARIDQAVKKAVDSAIDSLSEHYAIREIVKEIVSAALMKKLSDIQGHQ